MVFQLWFSKNYGLYYKIIFLPFLKPLWNKKNSSRLWKMAKIISFKKPGKPDYTNLNTFCPISLFSILNKVIKTVIVERIGYLVKRHSLLPLNHYRILKRKSITDALFTISEKIYQAWRDKKVLLLVIFDLKRAFNDMTTEIFVNCFWAHRILKDYIQ